MRECGRSGVTDFHVHRQGRKRCVCGELSNPSYRSRWQRFMDRRAFRRRQKELAR